MGVYFLMAVLSPSSESGMNAGASERWANAFGNDLKQVASLFTNMTNGYVYGKIVIDNDGRPIDVIYLDMNRAYETYLGAKKETVLGRRATEVFTELKNAPPRLVRTLRKGCAQWRIDILREALACHRQMA